MAASRRRGGRFSFVRGGSARLYEVVHSLHALSPKQHWCVYRRPKAAAMISMTKVSESIAGPRAKSGGVGDFHRSEDVGEPVGSFLLSEGKAVVQTPAQAQTRAHGVWGEGPGQAGTVAGELACPRRGIAEMWLQ